MDAAFAISGISLSLLGAVGIGLDVSYRKLPNWLCLIVLAVGIATTLLTGHGSQLGSQLLHGLVSLVIGMVLFRLGLVGGGDVKFYASVASWFPLALAGKFLLSVSLTSLFMLTVWFAWRRVRRIPIKVGSATDADKFPIGISIGAGAVLVFFRSILLH